MLSACSRTAPPAPAHSSATLIVEQSAATPGSNVNIGIQFAIESGWRVYWLNPGDSGEPPRMDWHLPPGFSAGPFLWPTPARMRTTAGTDYGYEGRMILLSSLWILPTVKPGNVEIAGDLRWLVCRDICIPQSTRLRTALQIAGTAIYSEPAHQLLLSEAARIPKSLPAKFGAMATNLPDSLRLTLLPHAPIAQAEFFPANEAVIDSGAAQVLASQGGTVSLVLKKSEYLRQSPLRLRGVLVLNGRQAYQVDVPIRNSSARERRAQK